MATFVEYQLADGAKLLVEAEEPQEPGLVRVSRDPLGNAVASAERTFEESLEGVRKAAESLYAQLKSLAVEEITITFGLKTAGEAGLFAIGKVSAEANFQVSLKWKKPQT